MPRNLFLQALLDQSFTLAMQPQVALSSGCVVSHEAFARLWHMRRYSPASFVPILEKEGLSFAFFVQILEKVARLLSRRGAAYKKSRCFVNVSPCVLKDPRFLPHLEETMDHYGLQTKHLGLEITESMPLPYTKATKRALEHLQNSGIAIALDDFGTQHSNLSSLQFFPFLYVKIPRLFVKDICDSPYKKRFLAGMVSFLQKHAKESQIILEGIETHGQRDCALEMGVALGQGFLYGKPVEDCAPLWKKVAKGSQIEYFCPK